MSLCKPAIIKALIAFTLVCVFNVVTYALALSYLFSYEGKDPEILLKVFGIASIPFAYPTVLVQNIIPLDGVHDTIVGIAVISVIETAILSWLYTTFRSRFKITDNHSGDKPSEI
jgi:hypothetical protein